MSSFQWHTLLDAGRALVAVFFVFAVLPRWVLPRWKSLSAGQAAWANMLVAGGTSVLLVHLLVLLNLYDGMTFLISLMGAAALAYLLRHGALSRSALRHLLTGGYTNLLRRLDDKGSPKRSSSPRDLKNLFGPWSGALGVLLLLTLAVRLLPVLQTTGPFSPRYYATLETAKHLQLNEPYYNGLLAARGLPSLLLALHALSSLDLAFLTHIFGALTALFVTYSIYRVVTDTTGSPTAALAGAAFFGLGSRLLPIAVEQQVEANGLLLAVGFALPALSLAGRHLRDGGRRTLWAAAIGGAAALLTSYVIGAVALVTIALLAGGARLLGIPRVRARRVLFTAGALAAAGGLALVGSHFPIALPSPESLSRFAALTVDLSNPLVLPNSRPPAFLIHLLVLSFGGPLLVVLPVARERVRSAIYGSSSAALLLLWASWNGVLPGLDRPTSGLLLTVALCVTAGLTAYIVFFSDEGRLVMGARQPTLPETPFRRLLASAGALALLVVLAWPVPARFEYTAEPAGFVKGMHAIKRHAQPYQWTVVSHHGTALRAMNQGRFMSYDYFTETYSPRYYDHTSRRAIPTKDLFLFVQKAPREAAILDELLPPKRDVMERIAQWCRTYEATHQRMKVFYEDRAVRIYRISRPQRDTLLTVKPLYPSPPSLFSSSNNR